MKEISKSAFGLSRRTFIAGAGFAALAAFGFKSTMGHADTPASGGKRTVVDLAGREVEIPENVTKVAALTGPVFETIIMLGCESQVVITGNKMGKSG